jgi:hypothetical protein
MVDSGEGNRSYSSNGVNMSEFELRKFTIINQLKGLCAHCANEVNHNCRLQGIVAEVTNITGVPLIVNDRFNGLLKVN